jgi:hypothetical protein
METKWWWIIGIVIVLLIGAVAVKYVMNDADMSGDFEDEVPETAEDLIDSSIVEESDDVVFEEDLV